MYLVVDWVKGWMKFKVDWEELIPYNGKYTNKGLEETIASVKDKKHSEKKRQKKIFYVLLNKFDLFKSL